MKKTISPIIAFLIIIFVVVIAGAAIFAMNQLSVERPIIEEPYQEDAYTKECFVGGCSSELCTDDPEVMSTCELLPGMECLTKEMSCELVEDECQWVLSAEAALCFLDVREEQGEEITQSRIGNLFEKSAKFLSQ